MEELINPDSDDPRLMKANRAFSPLAIVAFVFSLFSCFYLVNSMLAIVPVIAIIMSIISLIRIHSVDGLYGKRLAIAALAFACFVISTAVTYQQMARNHMFKIACEHADTYLKMCQEGELFKTHQLSYEYRDREKPKTDLTKHYIRPRVMIPGDTKVQSHMELKQFATVEPEISLRREGETCTFINEGVQYSKTLLKKVDYVVQYRLKHADTSIRDQVFWMTMRRTDHLPPIGPHWACTKIENMDPPFKRHLPPFMPPQ